MDLVVAQQGVVDSLLVKNVDALSKNSGVTLRVESRNALVVRWQFQVHLDRQGTMFLSWTHHL